MRSEVKGTVRKTSCATTPQCHKADKLGLDLEDSEVDNLLRLVKQLAVEKKRPLTDDEFLSLVKRPSKKA